ncbi:transposase [Noviherbaspirillum sedimenti]|uniref:transposase n=1 Tax=Noviherbaspirillum sedimenti TaxID=2320865 RepID=UPI002368E364|nr:transposase [Noviherbaspirillum sedimenti]
MKAAYGPRSFENNDSLDWVQKCVQASGTTEVAATCARRWVVERTHSWMNRFRGLLIRWEKKSENYLAFLHIACGVIAWRATGLLG